MEKSLIVERGLVSDVIEDWGNLISCLWTEVCVRSGERVLRHE